MRVAFVSTLRTFLPKAEDTYAYCQDLGIEFLNKFGSPWCYLSLTCPSPSWSTARCRPSGIGANFNFTIADILAIVFWLCKLAIWLIWEARWETLLSNLRVPVLAKDLGSIPSTGWFTITCNSTPIPRGLMLSSDSQGNQECTWCTYRQNTYTHISNIFPKKNGTHLWGYSVWIIKMKGTKWDRNAPGHE